MLRKLLKYEFQSQYGLYGGIYLFMLLLSAVAAAMGKLCEKWPSNQVFKIIFVISLVMVVIGCMAVFVITTVMSILRYRNNLLKDEGYLMHTLPVMPASLHFCKLAASFVWYAADMAIVTFIIMLLSGDWKLSWLFEMADIIGCTTPMAVLIIIYIALSALSSMSIFYAAMNLGSLSYSSKGVMSFVAYLIIYMVNELIALAGLAVFIVIQFGTDFSAFLEMNESAWINSGYTMNIMIMSVIISIIYLVGYNAISVYILNKKLNLE